MADLSTDAPITTDPFEQALLRADPRTLTAGQARERDRLLYGSPELAKAAPELSDQVKALVADARAAAEARAATDRRRRATRAARRLATRMGHDLGLVEELTAAQLAALQGLGELMLMEQRETGTASCDLPLAVIAEESGVARSTLIAALAHAVHRGWVRRISYRPEIDPETGQLAQAPSTYLPGPLLDRIMAWLDARPEIGISVSSTGDRKIGQTGFGVLESKQKNSSSHPESGGRPVRAGQARPGRPTAQRQPARTSPTTEALSSQPILIAPEGEHGISVGTPPPSVCASAAATLVLRGLKLLGEPVGGQSETALLAAVWRAHARFAQDWLKQEDLARAIRIYGWWAAACFVSTIIERAVRTRKPLTNPAGRFFWLVWKAVKQMPDPLAIPISIIDRHGSIGGEIAPPDTIGGEFAPTDTIGGEFAPTDTIGGEFAPTDTIGGEFAPPPATTRDPASLETKAELGPEQLQQAPREARPGSPAPAPASSQFEEELDQAIAWAETLTRNELLQVLGRLQVPSRSKLLQSGLAARLIVQWRAAATAERVAKPMGRPHPTSQPAHAADHHSADGSLPRADVLAAMRWFAALPAREHAQLIEARGRRDRVEHVVEVWRQANPNPRSPEKE